MSRLAESQRGRLTVTDMFEVGVERSHDRLEKAVVADKDCANAVIYPPAPADSKSHRETRSTDGV